MAVGLPSINYEYFYCLMEYENSVMQHICKKSQRDKECTYQTLLEASHTIPLLFRFAIHTMGQRCKGI